MTTHKRTQAVGVLARLGVHLDVEGEDAGVLLEPLLDVGPRLRHVLLEDGADAHLCVCVFFLIFNWGGGGV